MHPSSGSSARPKRALGQNFLVDTGVQRRIVEALGVVPGETVLEIGPGRGALTQHLTEVADHLVLVELDDALARMHTLRYADHPGVRVVHADILDVDPAKLVEDPEALRVVGNIPYNITTPILFHFLEGVRPADLHLMVQKEVADRILASPGDSGYGALTVGVRSVARVERVLSVSRGAFRPRPRVDSAVIRIIPKRPSPLEPGEEVALRRLVRSVFQWRRKQLQRTLRHHPELGLSRDEADEVGEALGVDLRRRPETLSPEEFIAMSRLLEGR